MKTNPDIPAPQAPRERGTSLVEVLVALLIFLFLMIGVLQMFSMAFIINKGSEARTEMTYKCQQVVENLRYLNALYVGSDYSTAVLPANVGVNFTSLADGYTYDFYNYSQTQLDASYWGPSGANVVESVNPRYALSLAVTDGGDVWTVTVTARPNPNDDANRYLGVQPARRIVEYVAQLPK